MANSEAGLFLKTHRSAVVNGVRNVDSLVDFFIQKDVICKEMGGNIRAQKPKQNQMRKLYEYLNSSKAYELTLEWLKKNEPDLIQDLESNKDLDDESASISLRKKPKTVTDHYSPVTSETFTRARGRSYRGTGSRGGTIGRGYRGTGSRGNMRGRGYRGARAYSRGRGYRGRGATVRPEDSEEARKQEREEFLNKLTLEEFREFGRTLLERQPDLVFDVLMMFQRRNDAPPSRPNPDLSWCRCGNCRDMPTDIEKKCCEQEAEYCISTLRHFSHLCLNAELLNQDIRGQEAEFRNEQEGYRRAAYGHFIKWKHGPLGPGNRVPIPSCCVWRIRDKYPDPDGEYTGFIPPSSEKQASYVKQLAF